MAAVSFKKKIEEYCASQGVTVPPGFGRKTPSRYAVIRFDISPARLVAKTWFKQVDLIYYLQNTLIPEVGFELDGLIEILDFKESRKLRYTGSNTLEVSSVVPNAQPNQVDPNDESNVCE